MEIKTSFAVFAITTLSAYFIGKCKGKLEERLRKQEETLNNLEHFLNNM